MPLVDLSSAVPSHKPPSRPPPPPPRIDTKAKIVVKSSNERLPSPRKNIENVPPRLKLTPPNKASSTSVIGQKSASPYPKIALKKVSPPKESVAGEKLCVSFSEHMWRTGECRECGRPKSEHSVVVDKLVPADPELAKRFAAIRNARLQAQSTLPRPISSSTTTSTTSVAPALPGVRSPTKLIRAERLKHEALTKTAASSVNEKLKEEELTTKEENLRERNNLMRAKEEKMKEDQLREATDRLKAERAKKEDKWKEEMWQEAEKEKNDIAKNNLKRVDEQGVKKPEGENQKRVSPSGLVKKTEGRLLTEPPKREAPKTRSPAEKVKAEKLDASIARVQTEAPKKTEMKEDKINRWLGDGLSKKNELVSAEKEKVNVVGRAATEGVGVGQKGEKNETRLSTEGRRKSNEASNLGRLKSVWEQKTKEENNNSGSNSSGSSSSSCSNGSSSNSNGGSEHPKVAERVKAGEERGQIVFRDGRLALPFTEKQPEGEKIRKIEQIVTEAKEKLQKQQLNGQQEKLSHEQRLKEQRLKDESAQRERQQEKTRQEKLQRENQERKQRELSELEQKRRQEEESVRAQEAARERSQAEARKKENARLKDKFNLLISQAAERRREVQKDSFNPGDSLDRKHADLLPEIEPATGGGLKGSGGVAGVAVCAEFKAHDWLSGKCDHCLGPKDLHKPAFARQGSLRGGTLKRDANIIEPKKIASNVVGSLKFGTLTRASQTTPRHFHALDSPRGRLEHESESPIVISEFKGGMIFEPIVVNLCGNFEEHAWRPNVCKHCKKDRNSHSRKAYNVPSRVAVAKPAVALPKSVKELAASATVFKLHVPNSASPGGLLTPESRGPATPIYPEVIPLDYLLVEDGAITPGSQIRKAKLAHKRRRRNTPKFVADSPSLRAR